MSGGTAVAKHDKGIKDTAAKSASEMARDESDTTVEDKGTEREEVVKEKGEGRMEETGEDGGSKEDKDGEEPLAEGEGPSQAEPPTDGDERLQEVAEASLEKMEKKEKEKKKDKKKDKKDKKEKKEKGKKAKKPRQEGDESPAPRRKSRGGGARGGAKQLEAILVSHFQPHDPSGTGYMDPSTFWEVITVMHSIYGQLGAPEHDNVQATYRTTLFSHSCVHAVSVETHAHTCNWHFGTSEQ